LYDNKDIWLVIGSLRGVVSAGPYGQVWCFVKEKNLYLVIYNSGRVGLRKKFTGKFAREYWFDKVVA
jgi:hypothetical protein